ncbi:unnamed protein product [Effrenium voratum]|uniref:Sushi domain-containing protein n=1 Tax=Effrenium voratum TaxID=2562239 RepID=A0AA36IDA4_9DINO|nr:unnamed protein product [Effrenium voratum]
MNATSVAGASSAVPERVGKEVSHEILDLTAASDLCRMMCSQLGSCVGFTFFDHVGGDRNVAQCCFLRRATRWQPNFRRASCHLARGLETRKGCFCQVGWEIAEGDSSALCRAQRRGCCTTPDNGARSWCPTTSPTCGTQLQNQLHWDACDPTGVAAVYEHTCRTHPQMKERNCASARGNSECNQIATVLGLPDTTPSLTLAMDMPSGCVWQKATSQLWLNQLVDAVNASDPSKKVAMSASEATAELCSCPPSVDFHWEAEEWRPCYGIVGAECHGARQRTRLVFCVQSDMDAESGRYQVVPSSLCSGQRPATVEACSGCDRMVLAAVAQFNLLQPVPGLEESAFAQSCLKNLALAAGLTEQDRMSVGKVECCNGAALEAEILVTDGDSGERSAADTVDQLMQISRSATYRSQVAWENGFGSLMQFFSLRIMGSYSWDISDSWGPCSQLCGGGFQSREVWCSWTGYESQTYQVGDMHCDAGSRPADQRACASRPCSSCAPFQVGPQYVVSGGDKEMSHENKVYVTCAAGYGTVDDVRLVESQCQDGEWTPLAVSCGKSCPAFVAASWKYEVHGSGNQHGSTRQVTCKRSETDQNSVEAPASASVICQDGSWTTPSLVCTGDCLTPELSSAYAVSQINGTSGDNIVQRGSVWHITCAPGFASSGKQPVKLECVEGSWSGLLDIPDCKADCPRYRLSEGYEVVGDADLHSIISFGQDTSSDSGGGGDRLRRMQLNVTGVVHGTSIGIRCVDGYGRVPGAVERLECFDGQWSSLSLFCAKDCKPFNATSLELSRFRVIMDMSRPNGEGEPSPSSGEPDAPHGSKIIIGCKLDEAADPGERAMKRGEVTCDNGRWIPSELRCFSDCEAFLPGPEYSVIIPGALAPQGNRSVPHGTQLLATCARGFSALPLLSPNASHEGWSSGTERRVTPNDLIVESECVDGIWTDLDLKCFADCPSWPLHQHLVVDSGGGLRAGSLLRLSCGQDTKTIRCGTHGIWELLLPADSDADSMKFQVGPPLNLENFTSICPHVSLDSRGAFMNLTFWAKLSDDERAMFMILALGCFGSLCGLACTYFLAPSAPESDEEEEPEVEAQEEDSANPGLRRFNLLTGELETSGQGNAGPSGPARGFHAEGSEGASCPLCGQFAFCIIDAKPSKVFDVPGPLDMAMTAAAAAASSLRPFATSTEFEKQLMPEDILHLRAMSMTIMQDPVCELRPEEAQRYVVDHEDEIGDLPVWHPRRLAHQVFDPFRSRKLAVARYHKLILERLDNEPLLAAFGIDAGFNMQAYFMILHAWLLHQRLVLEGSQAKKLDEELFEHCWNLTRSWLVLKRVPEYRFDAELQNVQEYMLGACIAMDKALERPDVLPARVQQCLWANMYSGSVKKDHRGLTRLTKYLLRQLGLMLQLDADRFLTGQFIWADFPVSDRPRKPLKLPEWREKFRTELEDNLGKLDLETIGSQPRSIGEREQKKPSLRS